MITIKSHTPHEQIVIAFRTMDDLVEALVEMQKACLLPEGLAFLPPAHRSGDPMQDEGYIAFNK